MGRTHDAQGFLAGAALAGVGASGLGTLLPGVALAGPDHPRGFLTRGDVEILSAAQIAETLAVTMYTNIIDTAPCSQEYFTAARQEEMSHYLVEEA